MYNLGDMSYKLQPKVMSKETRTNLFMRVKEHCVKHNIPTFVFSLHGGEPLLAGKRFFTQFVHEAKEILAPEVVPIFSVQTNGLLLDESWCKLLSELGFDMGISLDGTEEVNDMYRVDHKGKGTYHRIVAGLKTAQTHLHRGPGVLSVVNIDSDPLAVYNHYKELKVGSLDMLLPDYTYDNPPPASVYETSATPYADWMIAIFNQWFREKEKPRIRFFEYIIRLILGNDLSFDNMGSQRNELLVIETDGGIEAVDVLKACGDGFTKEGANVSSHDFDAAMHTPLAKMYHFSHQKLCKKCTICPVKDVCGGGYIPHRYSSQNGFNNPSIYCKDLMKIITHIQTTVLGEFPKDVLAELGVEPWTDADCLSYITQNWDSTPEPAYVDELLSFASVH